MKRIVTLDGPAGSGKGTIGQRLAVTLGWRFLDSGALYRAVAHLAKGRSLSGESCAAIVEELREIEFESIPAGPNEEARVMLNRADISAAIRTAECGRRASELAVNGTIRAALLDVQRAYYCLPGLVADGRDMGSVVFPDAFLKVFLTARLDIRAARKFKQLKEKDISLKYDKIYREIEERDQRDSSRSHAPLKTPEDALVVDTSSLNADETVQVVLEEVYSGLNRFAVAGQ